VAAAILLVWPVGVLPGCAWARVEGSVGESGRVWLVSSLRALVVDAASSRRRRAAGGGRRPAEGIGKGEGGEGRIA